MSLCFTILENVEISFQAQVETVLGALVKEATAELTKLFESQYQAAAATATTDQNPSIGPAAGGGCSVCKRDKAVRSVGVQVGEDSSPSSEQLFDDQCSSTRFNGECLNTSTTAEEEEEEAAPPPADKLLAEDNGHTADPKHSLLQKDVKMVEGSKSSNSTSEHPVTSVLGKVADQRLIISQSARTAVLAKLKPLLVRSEQKSDVATANQKKFVCPLILKMTDVLEPEQSKKPNVLKPERSKKPNVLEPEGSKKLDVLEPERSKKPDVLEPERSKKPNVLEPERSKKPNVLEPEGSKKPNILEPEGSKKPNVLEPERSKKPNVLEPERSKKLEVLEPEGSKTPNLLEPDGSKKLEVLEPEGSKTPNVLEPQRSKRPKVLEPGRSKKPNVLKPEGSKKPNILKPEGSKKPDVLESERSKKPDVLRPGRSKRPKVLKPGRSKRPKVLESERSKKPDVLEPRRSKNPKVLKPERSKKPDVLLPGRSKEPVQVEPQQANVSTAEGTAYSPSSSDEAMAPVQVIAPVQVSVWERIHTEQETENHLQLKLKLVSPDKRLTKPCSVHLVNVLASESEKKNMISSGSVAKGKSGPPGLKDIRHHQGPHTGHRLCCFTRCTNGVWRLQGVVSHSRSGYACSKCGKKFKHRKILRRHERFHSGEKPYACANCSKVFALRKSLRRHERFHTGERPHNCPHCGKSFRLRDNLKAHLRFHTGDKPFICGVCSKRFRILRNLQQHNESPCGTFVPSFRIIAGL